jgi:hypothetical protein
MGRCLRAVVAVLAAVPLAGCGTAGVPGDKAGGQRGPAPAIVTLAHAVTDAELRPFVDEVSRLSHGSVRVVPRGIVRTASGDDNTTVTNDVLAGRAQLGVVGADHRSGFEALTTPMAIDSLALQDQLLRSSLVEQMLAHAGSVPTPVLGVLPGPLVWPAGVGRALVGPNDFSGARIAMAQSDPATRDLMALDATLVPHNLLGADIPTADAIVAPVSAIAHNAYDGIATTLTTNLVLGARPLLVIGSLGRTDEVLRAAATAAIPAMTEFRRAEQAGAIAALCRRGHLSFVTATDTTVVAERIAAYQGKLTREIVNVIRRSRTADADIPTCRGVPGLAMRTYLDGEYEVTTKDGTFRITLDRGSLGGNWARGTYTVHGDLLTMNLSREPEPISYRWHLYRAVLTLYPIPGQHSLGELRIRPWRRTGDPPAAAATPVDGVYEVTTDEGRYRWTLDRGQLDQTRNGPDTWALGGYTVSGDLLTITYAQSGGEPLTSEHIKPGDSISYRWNLYRGLLQLRESGGGNSPPVFVTTWRRIGDVP